MKIFNPGGKSGVLLIPNVTSSAMYADIIGLCLDCLNKFNANLNGLSRRQNKRIGTFGSVLQSPAIKWFSKF